MPGIDPFSHPTMPLEELERFVAAVETLDRDAECPPPAIPDSLDDHVEVFRIADSCMHIEYHPLNGRTIWQARHEIKQADPTVHAVGFPSIDYQLLQASNTLDYDDYADQWHLRELDVAALQDGWPMHQTDQITVAIIDSGVDEDHSLLDGRITANSLNTCHTRPIDSHGTHVAGIVSAERGREEGVTGIAPNAQILPVSLFNLSDGLGNRVGTCPAIETLAIAVAEAWRASDIINMSLGGSRRHTFDNPDELALGLEWCSTIELGENPCPNGLTNALAICSATPNSEECNREQTLLSGENPVELGLQAAAMRGIVPVAAAGNHGQLNQMVAIQFPAGYDKVVAVANLEQDEHGDLRRHFDFTQNAGSAANAAVDLAAPGTCVLSTVIPNDGDRNCTPGGAGDDYEEYTGTSMAAPMIAGVVAHMKARFPQATVKQITEALGNTAEDGPTGQDSNCERPLTHDDCYGDGIVQPLRAINYLASLRAPIAYITDETGSYQIARIGDDGDKSVLTSSSDMNWGPSLSPDGLQIVFARGSPGDLWTIGANGAERQLTSTSQAEYAPSWSPDGNQIVYFRSESNLKSSRCGFLWLSTCTEYVRQPHEIWVVNSDGSDSRQLYSDYRIFAPSWMSDGTAILFDYNGDIASLDLGSRDVQILLSDGHNYCPSSSPDSSMIAYSSERPGNEEIYVMNADGTNRRRITDDPANDRCPEWMPDGKSLVFTSDRDGDEDIYIVDVDGTNLRPLTHNDHRDFQPSVTKSGEAAAIIASADLTVQLIDPLPAAVDAAGGEFAALSSSWDHVCSSLESRSALCWGSSASESESAPAEALTGASAGGGHSCALGSGGAVVCWGGGFLGQTDAPEGSFTAVAAGWDHTCGLNSSGGIECWGSDEHGQASPPSGRFTAVSAGDGHSCALDEAGRITCWGLDDDGQASPPSGRFTAIDTGSAHSCALDEAGAVTCWGANWFGQADTPEGSFVEVAAGYGHTCALDEGGLAFCWGLNNDFQANAPYRVFTTMTAGRAHACGLDIHAEVMCWGTIEPHDE